MSVQLAFEPGDMGLREMGSYKDRRPSTAILILDPGNRIVATYGEIPDEVQELVDEQATANAGKLDVGTPSAIVQTTRGLAIMSIARLEWSEPGFRAVFFEPVKTRRSDT